MKTKKKYVLWRVTEPCNSQGESFGVSRWEVVLVADSTAVDFRVQRLVDPVLGVAEATDRRSEQVQQ